MMRREKPSVAKQRPDTVKQKPDDAKQRPETAKQKPDDPKRDYEGVKLCNIKKAVFKYTVIVNPDGSIELKDKCGNHVKHKGRKSLPSVKKLVNTRTLTIMEATGSQWVYLDPPGLWYPLP